MTAYGLLQALGLDPIDWQTDAASPVLSTVGRANFLGSYLVLVAPLTAAWALQGRRRWPAWLLLTGQTLCLALTQARGAWLGAGAAALAFVLAWAAVERRWRFAALALAAAALAVGFVALLNVPGGPLTSLARLPGLERLASLTRTDAGSTAARLTIWRAALPLAAQRPWLGYGPETMRAVFARVYPPQLVYYQGRRALVDRAHNLWLDLTRSVGLAGAAAFAALLTAWGRRAWRGLRSADGQKLLWAALTAAVMGHLIDLQFGFELTASATVFWLLMALGATLGEEEPAAPPQDKQQVWWPYLLPLLATLPLLWLLCLRPLLADVASWRARLAALPYTERLAAARQAVRLWPLEPEYRYGLTAVLLEGGDFAAAEAQLDVAARLSPADPRVWAARGELYAAWGAFDARQYAQAEAAYRQVLSLAPDLAIYHAALGWTLAQQGRLEEGVAALERAVALDATNGLAFSYLAELYQALGREEEAEWARREAVRWRLPD